MIPTFRIAAIAGDGIGKEVMPEGLRVVQAAAKRFGFELEMPHHRLGQLRLLRRPRPDDAGRLEGAARRRRRDLLRRGRLARHRADNISLWGSLIKFRREFDQYINLRPVRLFEGVPCPLAGRKPGDIDYLVVRENTEGEYTVARRRSCTKAPSARS